MPPHRELNTRFQAHIRRARRARQLTAGLLSTCLLIGAGVAVAKLSPSTVAGATAAAASANTSAALDTLGTLFSKILHPNDLATSETPPENWKAQPPSQTAEATSSEPVALQSKAPTVSPTSSDHATASELAVSNNSHQGKVLGASTEQPIIERVVETVHDISGATLGDLAAHEARLNLRIDGILSPPQFPHQVGGNGSGGYSFAPAAAQKIDQLNNVTINNPTIVGGSISGTSGAGGGGIGDNATTTTFFASVGHFASGVIDALSSAAATITNLTATELVATNATTTFFAATTASTTNLTTGSFTLGSGTGILHSTSGVVSPIGNGADGQVLKIVGGTPAWSADLTGSGGGSSAWATTTDSLAV